MQPTSSILTALFALSLLASCGADKAAESSAPEPAHAAAPSTDGIEGLGLNAGSKWVMDDHTRDVIGKMASAFQGHDLAAMDEAALKAAGAELKALITELIQGCTMKGEAHDALHVLLSGYIPAVSALAKSGDRADATVVRHYLEQYDSYFE